MSRLDVLLFALYDTPVSALFLFPFPANNQKLPQATMTTMTHISDSIFENNVNSEVVLIILISLPSKFELEPIARRVVSQSHFNSNHRPHIY